MFSWVSQTLAVIGLSLRSLPQRAGPSVVAVVGITGVVVTFVAVLSIAEGFNAAMANAGSPDTAIIMRGGSNAELNSALELDSTRIIADAPGILRSDTGPMASSELFVIVNVPKRSTGTDANVPLRGIQPTGFDVRPEVTIAEGRRFASGTNEIIVGRAASEQFTGLRLGDTNRWGESSWTVVGIFEADGTISESEIWCDAAVLQPAYRRGSTFQSVMARLESQEAFQGFKDTLTTDPRLDVQVERESDYYNANSAQVRAIITGIGSVIALLMGVGAVFGAVNTMYNAVATRTREIATLRALGFRGSSVVFSVLIESALLASIGGVIGGGLAYAAFHGYQTATMNFQTFSQVSFAFTVTPALLVQGATYALVMGLVGGLFPAIRAARLPVATALREL
jgi:putative ABC transport system permease protein